MNMNLARNSLFLRILILEIKGIINNYFFEVLIYRVYL